MASPVDATLTEQYRRLGVPLLTAKGTRTVVDYFEQSAKLWPDNQISLRGQLSASINYRSVAADVRKLSAALRRDPFFRLNDGDHVGIHLPSSPYAFVATFAVWRAGLAMVPIDPTWTDEKYLIQQLNKADLKAIVISDFLLPSYLKVVQKLKNEPRLIAVHLSDYYPFWVRWLVTRKLQEKNRWCDLDESQHRAPHLVRAWTDTLNNDYTDIGNRAGENALAVLIYGSGTTSIDDQDLKLIEWTHKNLTAEICMTEAYFFNPRGDPRVFRKGRERILAVIPLSHSFGAIVCVAAAGAFGFNVDFVPNPRTADSRFDAKLLAKLITERRPTIIPLSPKHYDLVLAYLKKQGRGPGRRRNFGFVKLFISGSEKLREQTFQEWKEITGADIYEGYGLTEVCAAALCNHPLTNMPGTVGLPLPGQKTKIADEDGKELAPGNEGELLLKGDNIFSGYYGNAEATRRAFTEDGWFKTGDLCVVSPGNGTHRIVGRKKDISIIGGINVSNAAVEAVIKEYEAVEDAAVFGVEYPRKGEVLVAVVILKDHVQSANEETEKKLREFLDHSGKLERTAIPKVILFKQLADVPVTTIGKIKKKMLQKTMNEEMAKTHD
ncbi:MAG: hypothetical protein A2939_02980 [Parcubacteria group bacterium RIFCSPLOWO2_01_FULL_48_18]|nr:MAG: hypothetical protein A2939_02980 [Parcubacteria group bacterium RIFCSPLOWO2_01_FULL_48_18]